MPERRVVATGVGVIAPNGIGKEEFWSACLEGRSCVKSLTLFDSAPFASKIVARVENFDPRAAGLSEEEIERMGRYTQFAVVGSQMAVDDAGLNFRRVDLERVGVSIANAIADTPLMNEEFLKLTEGGRKPVDPQLASPHLYTASMFNTPSNEISARFGTRGICVTVSTGCTAGVDSLGFSYESIVNDEAEVMIAGAAEAPIAPISIAAFDVIGALSTRNDDPEHASRPFDAERDGFVLGEGCGIVVLEELQHALRRGARIYAEVVSFASACNAFHMTDLPPDGTALGRTIKLVYDNAEITLAPPDYVNAHGSSTPQNDAFETAAYKLALGDGAYRCAISSTKSMIGHPLSAASSIGFIASLLAIDRGAMHPTINYEHPCPECDLDYIPAGARYGEIKSALVVASGFSGIHSATTIQALNGRKE